DRADMKDLGEVFDSLAYEYTLPDAIRDGYLCKIEAQTIPLRIDMSGVGIVAGDFKAGDIDTALDPYLENIALEMKHYCQGRKTVVFLPLVKTSQKFCAMLKANGFRAAEVHGESEDRTEVLRDFASGKYDVLCNSMLLTEGWDCPPVDCIVVLRPTKSRALYSQMVGRGTRLASGKKNLLLLDFLWMTEKHELCRPAHLLAKDKAMADAMTKRIEDAEGPMELEEAEHEAEKDVVREREEALAEQLKAMRVRKRKLVDPLQFEMSIQAEDLANYTPTFGWELNPMSDGQKKYLESHGIFPDGVESAGKASQLIDRLKKRTELGLTTPKQIRFLESKGFQHVGTWPFEAAKNMIARISFNGWRVPAGVDPWKYEP
ncbi:MAG: helicase-related protein, partial [Veillonellaceae bacterium]|nr:helicase-related protein [Veillonellaceae bacterium]